MALLISGGVRIIGSTISALPVTPPPLNIGESFGGGYYAGLYSASGDGNPTHFLVVSPGSSETTLSWKSSLTNTPGTSSLFDGSANTAAMTDASHPAAEYCGNLTTGGYSDWYLPSRYELAIIYSNTRAWPGDNVTTSGINPYSVLPRTSNYSLYVPGEATYATVFRNVTAQFNGGLYWTSSSSASPTAWFINTTDGTESVDFKDQSYTVRAIRKVPYYTQQTGVSYGPYRYWRMYITKVREASNLSDCQMAEFKFQVDGIDRDLYGATLTNPGGVVTAQEEVYRLIDNSMFYKFYNAGHYNNGTTDIRFDFGTAVSFTGYRWATANDVISRDPESWTIQAGATTATYTTIHTVTGYTATTARNTWQNPWTFT